MLRTTLYLAVLLSFLRAYPQNFESELENIFESYELMGMSVYVSSNEDTEQFHFGLRDFDRNLPVNESTKFRIASISKSVTALGLLKLVSDGLLSLDDDISTYLGYTVQNPQFPNTPITFRMLLSHTSSLQDGTGYSSFLNGTFNVLPVPNISELIVPDGTYYSPNMWRTENPGTHFAYSNINFGILGTLIEKISGERFDIYMKTAIFDVLGLDCSYNVRDLTDINNVAVLYRNIGGNWQSQADNYEGVAPSPPDLGNYTPGTNGVYFGPQGSLRISAQDTATLLSYISSNGEASPLEIDTTILEEMKAIAWDFNGSNGDNYFGLFNRWGLGLHHANVTTGDQICNLGVFGSFIGHPGEAFGLVSDSYFNLEENLSFTLVINGSWNGYQLGENSSYYTVEEDVFTAICTHFESLLSVEEQVFNDTILMPNPAKKSIFLQTNTLSTTLGYSIYDLKGSTLLSGIIENSYEEINISSLSRGIYYLQLNYETGTSVKKFIVQ